MLSIQFSLDTGFPLILADDSHTSYLALNTPAPAYLETLLILKFKG